MLKYLPLVAQIVTHITAILDYICIFASDIGQLKTEYR